MRREQLRSLALLLEQADAVLFHRLRQIGAGECFFAYRMLIVQAKRELPLSQARKPDWAHPVVPCFANMHAL